MSRPTEPVSFEDPLALLPRKPVQQFARKRLIYGPQRPADGLYVVVAGRVKVSQSVTDGTETIIRIVSTDGIFGESAMLGSSGKYESAVTIEPVKVMAWSAAEIESHIVREPRLGLALVQYMVRQCMTMEERIQCMAICKTPERVALALVQLADATGVALEDGALRMGGLTHHTLAEYVGTSRTRAHRLRGAPSDPRPLSRCRSGFARRPSGNSSPVLRDLALTSDARARGAPTAPVIRTAPDAPNAMSSGERRLRKGAGAS